MLIKGKMEEVKLPTDKASLHILSHDNQLSYHVGAYYEFCTMKIFTIAYQVLLKVTATMVFCISVIDFMLGFLKKESLESRSL